MGESDYAAGNVEEIRAEMVALSKAEPLLNWLHASGPVLLKDGVLLVGQDQRYVEVYDDPQEKVDKLKVYKRETLYDWMQILSDMDANQLRESIIAGVNLHHPQKVIVLVHLQPPFRGWFAERGGSQMQFTSAQATADVLWQLVHLYTHIDFVVLYAQTPGTCYYNDQLLRNFLIIEGRRLTFNTTVFQELIV